ncbi:unnamed protein product [Miscanthus lutarioriparius]|uniref:BTB domain-containing protein n=1 Tax=Miscanthus lutarioriparius TaxID=422564 RepID=A0A811QB87_9POAL|nr:unnamed protein product [Miscanthus lutarioriparius]
MPSEHHLFEIAATGLGGGSPGPHFKISSDLDDSSWSPCIQGYNWRCVDCTDPAAGTTSFTLCLPYSSTREPLNASFKLSLLDRGGWPVPFRTRAISFQNCVIPQMLQWECPGFITRDDLQRQEYLTKDGRFTVRCDIAVKPFTAKEDVFFVTVPPSDLHRHLGDLLARKDGADVTFQLVEGGETFSAHRCVLAARSPVFRAQLFGEMMESKSAASGVIPTEDMEAQTADDNTEEDGDDDEAMPVTTKHLHDAADRYGLERMKLVCQEKLCKHIRAGSVAAMLALADRHHCPGLKEACFHFFTASANLDSFTQTDGFEVLNASCPAVLKELLARHATVLIF